MKYTYIFLSFFMLSISSAYCQLYGTAGLGVMNYAGDLQDKSITLSECSYNFNIGGSYQFAPNFLTNLSLTYGKIGASDAKNEAKWINRNLSFKSSIFEAAITAEADLFDIRNGANPMFQNTEDQTNRFTPYGFAGIGIFNFNPYTNYQGKKVFLQPLETENETQPYSLWQISIPFGLGIKYAITDNIIIAGEMDIRKTFTDYLDDVSAVHFVDTTLLADTKGPLSAALSYRASEKQGTHYPFYGQRGNPNKKDVFYSFNLKVIFRFGEGESLFKYGYGN